MSTFHPRTVPCPSCDTPFEVHLLEGLHITRLPAQRQAILDGTFHVFRCPSCGDPTVVEAPAIYTDFDRHHYVAVEVEGDWREARRRHQKAFDDAFTLGPPMAEELGRSMTCRLVFGYRALREKLLCFDHGVDDRVLEALKAPRGGGWRLREVLAGRHLLCDRRGPSGAVEWHTFTADTYADALERRADAVAPYPWLAEPWFVDTAAGAVEPRAESTDRG